jgi:hypothetical protein
MTVEIWKHVVFGYLEFLDTLNFGRSIPTLAGILHTRNQAFDCQKSFRLSLEVPTALWKTFVQTELKIGVVESRKWMKSPRDFIEQHQKLY